MIFYQFFYTYWRRKSNIYHIFKNIKEGYGEGCTVYKNKEELINDLLNIICEGDIILVKASRSLKFEEITKALLEK